MSFIHTKGEGGCEGRPQMPMSDLLSDHEKSPNYVHPEEKVRELRESGRLVRGCKSCDKATEYVLIHGYMPFAPAHEASSRCRSGGHPHCTCDTCF